MRKGIKLVGIILLLLISITIIILIPKNNRPFFYDEIYTKEHQLYMLSPHNEKPNSLPQLIEITKKIKPGDVRKRGTKVAVSMHDLNNDWSQAVLDGIKDTLSYYNIQIVEISDGEFKTEKQIVDINNLISLKPNILISLPLDGDNMIDVYNKAKREGIDLIFLDSIPGEYKPGIDYLGFVIGDSYQLGYLSAKKLIDIVGNSSEVAILKWAQSMYTVDQRVLGAEKAFNEMNVESIKNLTFSKFYEIEDVVNELINFHPATKGLWAVWDTPAFEAINVLKSRKSDIAVATVDMNSEVANSILKNEHLKITAVDHPYSAGIALALQVVLAREEVAFPSYVVIHAESVDSTNVKEVWKNIYNKSFNGE